jgi:hypothetical protein
MYGVYTGVGVVWRGLQPCHGGGGSGRVPYVSAQADDDGMSRDGRNHDSGLIVLEQRLKRMQKPEDAPLLGTRPFWYVLVHWPALQPWL